MKSAQGPKKNSELELLMFESCRKGAVGQVRELISAGVSSNARDLRGDWLGATPLMYAVKFGRVDCAKVLLEAGGDPNLADSPIPLGGGRRTSLYFAAQNRDYEMVRMLLEAGAAVNAVSNDENTTALGCAVANSDKRLAILLIKSGANPNLSKKDDGISPLHIACTSGRKAIIPILIDSGADINAQDNIGGTALSNAVFARQSEIVRELLKRGAKVNLADKEGWTPLMYAVVSGRADMVKLLLANGAEVNAKTRDGKTALDIAIRDQKRIAKSLLVNVGGKRG